MVIMENKQLFLAQVTEWSSAIAEATPEPELLASLDQHLQLQGRGDSQSLLEIARAIALTENAERVQSKVNLAYIEVVKDFSISSHFSELSSADPETAKVIIEAIALKCVEEGERTASHYISKDSRTWTSLRLKKAKKVIEGSLLDMCKDKEVASVSGLLGKIAQFFAEFQEFVGAYMQKLRDEGQPAPLIKGIWEELKGKCEPAYRSIPGLPKICLDETENRFKAAFLQALLQDFGPYASAWIRQIHSGGLTLFDTAICRDQVRQLVLSAALSIIPQKTEFDRLREQLKEALKAEEVANWTSQLSELRGSLPMQEKFFTILSLTLFFANADSHCQATHRHFLKEITLTVFSTPDSIYPVSEWLLVHICEKHISLNLEETGTRHLHLPIASDLMGASDELQLASPVTVLELLPLSQMLAAVPLHVTIVIPGWLSEKKDLQQYWQSVAKYSYFGEVLGMKWEAEGSTSMLKKEASRLADLFGEFWNPVGLLTSVCSAASLVHDSTFSVSAQKAVDTGRVLAYMLKTRAFGNVTVSLIGFSLGGRMVAAALSALANEPEVYVQDAIIIGAAISHDDGKWAARRKAVAGRLVNVMSSNDEVLGHLYLAATGEIAAGIHSVDVEGVENFDATEYVSGHGQHPVKLDKTLTRINLSP